MLAGFRARDRATGPPRAVSTVRRPPASMATETAPSRPVCSTVAPTAFHRETTSRCGNPCRLCADAETTATRGAAAATKGAVDEVRLPW